MRTKKRWRRSALHLALLRKDKGGVEVDFCNFQLSSFLLTSLSILVASPPPTPVALQVRPRALHATTHARRSAALLSLAPASESTRAKPKALGEREKAASCCFPLLRPLSLSSSTPSSVPSFSFALASFSLSFRRWLVLDVTVPQSGALAASKAWMLLKRSVPIVPQLMSATLPSKFLSLLNRLSSVSESSFHRNYSPLQKP